MLSIEKIADATRILARIIHEYRREALRPKVIHIFFSMDSMVGKQFEEGLANLKTIAEH